jgi:hypothetical protein
MRSTRARAGVSSSAQKERFRLHSSVEYSSVVHATELDYLSSSRKAVSCGCISVAAISECFLPVLGNLR